jgi:3-hydroxyethyl bacteriochlorophyllide a dehydrogenase
VQTAAIILSGPRLLGLDVLDLTPPGAGDVVVEISHSGISTGTEKLFWEGRMPPFPGMGYPLVPGYEAAGEIVEAPAGAQVKVGDRVFVPGATCFGEVRGLFGAAARHIVTPASRVTPIDSGLGAEGALLALAAASSVKSNSACIRSKKSCGVAHKSVALEKWTLISNAPLLQSDQPANVCCAQTYSSC